MSEGVTQLELIESDGIFNKYLEYFDENEKPDCENKRRFFLEWDDFHAFLVPGQTRNRDGSVHRGQVFHADPQKYIDEGYQVRSRKVKDEAHKTANQGA